MPWAKGNYKGRAVTVPATHHPTDVDLSVGTPNHDTAARYRTGCRCDGCRRAYAAVQRDRRARVKRNECDWIVSADMAREHLIELRKAGVGKRAVMDCTGISDVVLMEIRNGKRQRIRQSTEEKIMRVTEDARSGGALVSGKPSTWLIDELIGHGYTMAQLATHLGYTDKRIQFYGHKYVTATNVMRIEKMHKVLMREKPESETRVDRMMRLAEHRTRLIAWQKRKAA